MLDGKFLADVLVNFLEFPVSEVCGLVDDIWSHLLVVVDGSKLANITVGGNKMTLEGGNDCPN